MRKIKTQKGITLVALIITIVVLLILALVTINAVRGDGIIGKAQKAREEYEKKSDEENATLEGYLAFLEENMPGGSSSGGTELLPGEENTEPTQQIGIETIAETNSTITGEPYRRTNPIIPAGFKAINTDTSKWDAESGPEVDNGLVISDGTNEFVWVPVTRTIAAYGLGATYTREPDVVTDYDNESANLNKINNVLGTNYQNSEDFKTALTDDFNSMATSTNKYGGFYVGRYEMSLSSDMIAQSKYGETSSNAEDEYTNTWYGLYARAKTYKTSSVKSSMIWGIQYNAMVNWMGEAARIKIGDNRNKTRQTGTAQTDKIKNVYDLYGNSYEWTLAAADTDSRVFYGGTYYSDGDDKYNHRPIDGYRVATTQTFEARGSRMTLYIV